MSPHQVFIFLEPYFENGRFVNAFLHKRGGFGMFFGVFADGRWKCVTQIALITQFFDRLGRHEETGRL
jgi:hypothetical protein